jgi:hypothetical protein
VKGPTVIAQDYHRNGIGGVGFVVSLVQWPEAGRDTFVAVSFYGDQGDEGASPRHRMGEFQSHTAVLSVDLLSKKVIDMFATPRGNAWRGADYVGPAVAAAWREHCRTGISKYDPFDPDWLPAATEEA